MLVGSDGAQSPEKKAHDTNHGNPRQWWEHQTPSPHHLRPSRRSQAPPPRPARQMPASLGSDFHRVASRPPERRRRPPAERRRRPGISCTRPICPLHQSLRSALTRRNSRSCRRSLNASARPERSRWRKRPLWRLSSSRSRRLCSKRSVPSLFHSTVSHDAALSRAS